MGIYVQTEKNHRKVHLILNCISLVFMPDISWRDDASISQVATAFRKDCKALHTSAIY